VLNFQNSGAMTVLESLCACETARDGVKITGFQSMNAKLSRLQFSDKQNFDPKKCECQATRSNMGDYQYNAVTAG
jgi:hypothetical protein